MLSSGNSTIDRMYQRIQEAIHGDPKAEIISMHSFHSLRADLDPVFVGKLRAMRPVPEIAHDDPKPSAKYPEQDQFIMEALGTNPLLTLTGLAQKARRAAIVRWLVAAQDGDEMHAHAIFTAEMFRRGGKWVRQHYEQGNGEYHEEVDALMVDLNMSVGPHVLRQALLDLPHRPVLRAE